MSPGRGRNERPRAHARQHLERRRRDHVGTSVQHEGGSRDPFTVLPTSSRPKPRRPPSPSRQAPSSSGFERLVLRRQLELGTGLLGQRLLEQRRRVLPSGSSKSGGSSGGGSGGKSGGSKPSEPKTVYDVSVLFGEVTAGSSGQGSGLTPYENLKLFTPLPSKEEPLVVFRGVTKGGKTATFTVAAETILQGPREVPAERHPVRSGPAAGRSERAAAVPQAGHPERPELRTAARQHHFLGGFEGERGEHRPRSSRRPASRCCGGRT